MKGERLIESYLEAVIERDSYLTQDGEEQTEGRQRLLLQAQARMKIAYSKLNGSMLSEVRRRLGRAK
jgi:hypothetical protein